jgi:hypothetical protein
MRFQTLNSSLTSTSSSSLSLSLPSSSRSLKAMVSRRSLIGAGETFRKASYRDVSVGLQIEKLEILLCETSIEYCENDTLVQQIRVHFSGLAARKHFSNKELSREELGEIVDTLKEILNTSPRLPAQLVAYIHSTIGLVRQLRGDNKCAIHAFMKALWIATSTHHDPNAEEIGLTVHRLGIAHGRNCDYNEAAILLEKALAIYRCGGMTENHPYLASATRELEELRPKLEHDLRRAVSTSGVITVHEESST